MIPIAENTDGTRESLRYSIKEFARASERLDVLTEDLKKLLNEIDGQHLVSIEDEDQGQPEQHLWGACVVSDLNHLAYILHEKLHFLSCQIDRIRPLVK